MINKIQLIMTDEDETPRKYTNIDWSTNGNRDSTKNEQKPNASSQ